MVSFDLFDIVGLIGSACILLAYFLLQQGKLSGESKKYFLMNAIGAFLVLISLYYDFNLAAAILESTWLIVSLLGLGKRKNP